MHEGQSERVQIGLVGLGGRGRRHLGDLLAMEDVAIPAVCDRADGCIDMGLEVFREKRQPEPQTYNDYRELLAHGDIEGIIVATSGESHIEVSLAAMNAGKYTAVETEGAVSLEECWRLVRTFEATGSPCMMLENCCYGRNEMAVLNMVKKGLFGELIHCQCGYQHDLRDMLVSPSGDLKLLRTHHIYRNADLYPPHGLGPAAKYLNVNRGNRFLSLTSMASKARGLRNWAVDNLGTEHPLANTAYAKGDVVTTMISCAGGETIMIVNSMSLPRPYSRGGCVQGTKGIWMEDNNSIYFEGSSPKHQWESFDTYLEEYDHPLWKENRQLVHSSGGHGGMDYIVLRAFIESVKHRQPPPVDVYDAAAWRAATVLSEQSISLGSAPVDFPDFTQGRWVNREPAPPSKYSLTEVDEELFE